MQRTRKANISQGELERIADDAQKNILATLRWLQLATETPLDSHTTEDVAVARLNLRGLYTQMEALKVVARS